ncbi:hypothetical protein G6F57_022918 [Rhizopus arrhizus]|nr:hypothetical protein G6F57_022918 [Rhizopus arrhizus]
MLTQLIGEELETEIDEDTVEDVVDEDKQDDANIDLDNTTEAAKLIKEEATEKGQVKFKVYATYLAACGGWFFWSAVAMGCCLQS